MSIFSKQTQWTNYLNSLIKKNNPFASRPFTDDSLLRVEEDKEEKALAQANEEQVRAKEESDAVLSRVESEADERLSAGGGEREKASAQSSALYDLLLDFTRKQESRYDDLIEELHSGSYLDSDATKDILASYEEKGRRAAGHALAEAAGANGGNPDTYAAAQGNRQQLAFLDAGHAQAQSYYAEQLERLLSAVRASSSDVGDLFGEVQNNVNATDKRADNDLSIGAELLKALADAKEKEQARAEEALEKAQEKADAASVISPMELDVEYESLVSGKGSGFTKYTPREALTLLWNKYPAMREYIREKYEGILNPSFSIRK